MINCKICFVQQQQQQQYGWRKSYNSKCWRHKVRFHCNINENKKIFKKCTLTLPQQQQQQAITLIKKQNKQMLTKNVIQIIKQR